MSSDNDNNNNNNNNNRPPIPPATPSLNGDRGRNFRVSTGLSRLNVTILQKNGITVWILLQHNGEERGKVITFKIKKEGPTDTIDEFQKVANKNEVDIITQQGIIFELTTNPEYKDLLQYRAEDDADLREGIGIPTDHMNDFFIDDTAAAREVAREQDPRATEIAEEEYNDEGLPLLEVNQVLKLDRPQRVRLVGQIQLIRPRYDLIKQIIVNCDNEDCANKNKRERYNLKSGLYHMGDLPYVFPGGRFNRLKNTKEKISL